LLTLVDGSFRIPSGATVQILTKEAMSLSSKVVGTVHSRVLLVSRGLSHISTTIDAGWSGPLLITTTNFSGGYIAVSPGQTFATVMFHTLQSRSKGSRLAFSFVRELLTEQVLQARSENYVQRVAQIVSDVHVTDEFRRKLSEANGPLLMRMRRRVFGLDWKFLRWWLITFLLWVCLCAIASFDAVDGQSSGAPISP
jgi:hypothetical protein